jgi:hypothetical protein
MVTLFPDLHEHEHVYDIKLLSHILPYMFYPLFPRNTDTFVN